jgi:opacity protein-like surface antigen
MKRSKTLVTLLLTLSASAFSLNAFANTDLESRHTVGLQNGVGGIEYKGKDTDGEGVGLSYLYYNYQFSPSYYLEVGLVGAADIDDWECKEKSGNSWDCFSDYDNNFDLQADNFEYGAVVLALKTDLSLSKRNRLYAKVGAAFYDYKIDLDHTRITDESGTGLFLEAGWEYRWDNGFGLNTSLQYQGAGDLDIDTFNVGISYAF